MQQALSVIPTYTGIGNALAVGERLARHYLLVPCRQVAFDHDPNHPAFAAGKLAADVLCHLVLPGRVFTTVGMAEIDHQARCESRGRHQIRRSANTLRVVIGLGAAAQDQMTIIVAAGREDRRVPILGQGQEVMRMLRRADRVDRDLEIAVGTILEAHRARQARGHLPVQLALGGAGANRPPADEIGQVLGCQQVQVLGAGRHALAVDIE